MSDTHSEAVDQLLKALAEHSLIKAVLLVDTQGRVKSKRGDARVLKAQAPGVQINAPRPPSPPTQPNRENVYMMELLGDVLVLVFDEGVDFERVRASVDRLLVHVGIKEE